MGDKEKGKQMQDRTTRKQTKEIDHWIDRYHPSERGKKKEREEGIVVR